MRERKIDLTFNDVSVVSMRTICTVPGSGEVVSRSVSNQRITRTVSRTVHCSLCVDLVSFSASVESLQPPCSCRMVWVVAKDTVL